jgi:hypothetical protein
MEDDGHHSNERHLEGEYVAFDVFADHKDCHVSLLFLQCLLLNVNTYVYMLHNNLHIDDDDDNDDELLVCWEGYPCK